MSDKRYSGNIISSAPVEPSGPYQGDAASGVWSLAEAYAYTKAGLWPTAGNVQYGVFGGGRSSGVRTNIIDYIDIGSTGNATDWGDLTAARFGNAACGNSTRGIFIAGGDDVTPDPNVMDYITYASKGNAVDFGDTTYRNSTYRWSAASNSTRGVITTEDNIIYLTIATTGNTSFFGNWSANRGSGTMSGNSTRALIFAGVSAANTIDYVTIATTGSATSFGNCTDLTQRAASASSSTRALVLGGRANSGSSKNTIEFVTIATTGNATDFGDLTVSRQSLAATGSETRAVAAGGDSDTNLIDYVTIASAGNAADFGDLTVGRQDFYGTSNVHGGLS